MIFLDIKLTIEYLYVCTSTIIKTDMVNVIEDNILNRLTQILTVLQEYKYIYISIGSKPNQRIVPFTQNDKRSNAYEQMFPVFMQRDDNKILVIVIDKFDKRLSTHVSNQLNTILTENIDFYILNSLCSKKFLSEFLQIFVEKLKGINFPPSSFMICNYVRFMNTPNKIELDSEKYIPQIIQEKLNETETYDNCFYQWFGYRYYFYNYVYKYKNLQRSGQIVLKGINSVEILLEKLSKQSFTTVVLQDKEALFILKNMYNICEPNHVNEYIISNAYDEFKHSNVILSVT